MARYVRRQKKFEWHGENEQRQDVDHVFQMQLGDESENQVQNKQLKDTLHTTGRKPVDPFAEQCCGFNNFAWGQWEARERSGGDSTVIS